MHIMIVDQCSASKDYNEDIEPLSTEEIDKSSEELIHEMGVEEIRARDLYQGKQQNRIDNAARILRTKGVSVDRFFVSAGFGLVSECDKLPPYDVTFAEMSSDEVKQRGEDLNLTEAIEKQVSGEAYDIIVLALGSDYYKAISLERVLDGVDVRTIVILFNQESIAGDRENVVSIPARTEQAREMSSAVIGLKGTYLERFASNFEENRDDMSLSLVERYFIEENQTQTDLSEY